MVYQKAIIDEKPGKSEGSKIGANPSKVGGSDAQDRTGDLTIMSLNATCLLMVFVDLQDVN